MVSFRLPQSLVLYQVPQNARRAGFFGPKGFQLVRQVVRKPDYEVALILIGVVVRYIEPNSTALLSRAALAFWLASRGLKSRTLKALAKFW